MNIRTIWIIEKEKELFVDYSSLYSFKRALPSVAV